MDDMSNAKYGKVLAASSERFRKDAETYCVVDYPEEADVDRMFESLAGCWKEFLEMDNVGQVIRESRTTGFTRHMIDFTVNEN